MAKYNNNNNVHTKAFYFKNTHCVRACVCVCVCVRVCTLTNFNVYTSWERVGERLGRVIGTTAVSRDRSTIGSLRKAYYRTSDKLASGERRLASRKRQVDLSRHRGLDRLPESGNRAGHTHGLTRLTNAGYARRQRSRERLWPTNEGTNGTRSLVHSLTHSLTH